MPEMMPKTAFCRFFGWRSGTGFTRVKTYVESAAVFDSGPRLQAFSSENGGAGISGHKSIMPAASGLSSERSRNQHTEIDGFDVRPTQNHPDRGLTSELTFGNSGNQAGILPKPGIGPKNPPSLDITLPRPLAVRVGRPRQPPSVKAISRSRGRVVWRVLATINGKQQKKICATQGEAELVAHQWNTAQACDLQSLPTRFTPDKLRMAEAADTICANLGLSMMDAVLFVAKYYKRPSSAKWIETIADYESDRAKQGISESQISNVAKAAKRLASFLARPEIGDLTQTEIETFLGTLPEDASPSTYNGLLGDVRTLCRWAVSKKHLAEDPTANIERRRIKRGLPEILRPAQAEALIRDVEKNNPGWVPYLCISLFGATRPGLREGEASRLNAALRKKQNVIHAGGIEIDGKANGIRIVPWSLAGPLEEWLKAYPPKNGIWPCKSDTIAEREWAKIRTRHSLAADVLRHTGITAMAYAPEGSLAQVAIAAGNSEAMIRKHYLGRWSKEDTARLWSIKPLQTPTAAL